MTRILFDTNVLLDVVMDRKDHVESSAQLWTEILNKRANGLVAAHAITTIHYLVRRSQNAAVAMHTVREIMRSFEVAAVDHKIVRTSVSIASKKMNEDFEDIVTFTAAEAAGCDLIVTRDPKGFRHSPILAIAPEEALRLLAT